MDSINNKATFLDNMLQIYISLPWHIVDPFQFSTAYVHPRSWNIQFRFWKIFNNLFLYYWSEIVNSRSSLQIIGKFGLIEESRTGEGVFSRKTNDTGWNRETKPSKVPNICLSIYQSLHLSIAETRPQTIHRKVFRNFFAFWWKEGYCFIIRRLLCDQSPEDKWRRRSKRSGVRIVHQRHPSSLDEWPARRQPAAHCHKKKGNHTEPFT